MNWTLISLHLAKKAFEIDHLLDYLNHQISLSQDFPQYFHQKSPKELCDRLKFLLQKSHTGNNSDIISEEISAIEDKSLKDKGIS